METPTSTPLIQKNIDFFSSIGEFLNDEEEKVVFQAVYRLLKEKATPAGSLLNERLDFLPVRFKSCKTVQVVDFYHGTFRLLAEMILGGEDLHNVMRRLLAIQMITYRCYYVRNMFDGQETDFDDYLENIQNDDACDEKCLEICADLFQIKIRDIVPYNSIALYEYSPASVRGLETLDEDKEDSMPRKTFWINHAFLELHSVTESEGLVASKIASLCKLLGDKAQPSKVVSYCHNFFAKDGNDVISAREDARLDSRLKEMGFTRDKIIGDGNCVFRAFSHKILDNEEHHLAMRKLVIAMFIRKSHHYKSTCNYRRMIDGPPEPGYVYDYLETWRHYRKRLSKEYEWANDHCIQAIADIFCVKVIVLSSNKTLVMKEFYPYDTKSYYGPIFLCRTTFHLECMRRVSQHSQPDHDVGPSSGILDKFLPRSS